ncbi:hypothetical protein VTN77DRAFT_2019 [Rasamsonia byssochlamydoides]|uniref:uncharacterized protein n=1 Tax=Rasamsonia byssochlamydoides TaxID=89139 RepID=UPI003743192E
MLFFRVKSLSIFFFGLLSWILLLSSPSGTALAAPVSPGEITARAPLPAPPKPKPKFPSKSDCENKLKKGQPPENKSIFFTGLNRQAMNQVKSYAISHSLTHVGAVYPDGFTNVGQYEGSGTEQRDFQKAFSEVYAEHTSGTAYLMMDYNEKPGKNSIFYSVEFKAMKASGKVDKIVWLDINNKPADPKTVDKIWWKKGDPDPATKD